LVKLPFHVWVYLGAVLLGLVLAFVLESNGTSIGERVLGLVPEEPLEEKGREKGAAWYQTQIGWTAAILAIVTLVLGWHVTEINLYYVAEHDRSSDAPLLASVRRVDRKDDRDHFPGAHGDLFGHPCSHHHQLLRCPQCDVSHHHQVGRLSGQLCLRRDRHLAGAKGRSPGHDASGKHNDRHQAPRRHLGTAAWARWPALVRLCGVQGDARPLGHEAKAARQGIRDRVEVLASLFTMVVFAGSWRIFVRDFGFWPHVVLAIGAAAGLVLGLRQSPDAEFPVGELVYGVIRFILNTTRSIEPFVWALIFVTWFRLGPFPGMVALMVHSVAALGKLYSEQIESIDPGPVEAVRATGANELQTVVYAIVPQVIPPFISFTIYRWDINVRMSTIIGLVGGGGVGHPVSEPGTMAQGQRGCDPHRHGGDGAGQPQRQDSRKDHLSPARLRAIRGPTTTCGPRFSFGREGMD